MRFFLDRILWIILAGNKYIAKIKILSIYPVEIFLILYASSINPFKVLKWAVRLWPAVLLLTLASIWLIHDIVQANGEWKEYENILRRYAMGTYFIIPILLLSGELKAVTHIKSKYLTIVVATFLFYLLWRLKIIEYSPSWAAFVIAVLLILHIGKSLSKPSINTIDILSIYLMIFIYLITIKDPGGGFYRSPILALSVGIVYIIINNIYKIKKTHLIIYSISIIFMIIMSWGFYFTPTGNKFYKEAYCSASAVLGTRDKLGSCAIQRSRGDPAGTIKTRLSFWSAINAYNTSDPFRFFFGSGHTKAFLEVVPTNETLLPMQARNDAALIEPHNSYMGIYFRYGIFGLLFFAALLIRVSSICALPKKRWDRTASIGVRIMALIYISTEVALEVPYGAMIFWLVWFLTCNIEPTSTRRSVEKACG